MSIKLRELIRAVRACKTAQDERAVISKECALIRTAFKENNVSYRHRNVAKLLFIHMLGYPSHFGQMECLKLIASPNFPEKRIGYLAMMLLLDERTEVLTLVTNSIKNDLVHHNQYVVGLALTSIGNLATADMGRILISDTERVLKGPNPYLKKKAALVMIRIFKRVPEMIEEFSEKIMSLMKERSHSVLITAVQLMIAIMELEPAQASTFGRLVPSLVRLLKNLLSMGYSPEHDVSGITDPFLQVKLLHLLQLLGRENEEASDAMNDVLAQVATNTETAKNAGNAILYECVKAIMTIEAESGLRVLAVNILGRFLLNRDNNIRYVALNTLGKVVAHDTETVQRHRNTIVDCLKDPDISIRQRALDLIYQLTNSNNVTDLMREMLNYLVVASNEQKGSLCSKIMNTVDRYSPSRRWQIDTLTTMLSIAGNSCDDSITSNTVMYIMAAEELHKYVVHKLFALLEEDLNQVALVHVGVWCIGEYGDLLLEDSPAVGEDQQGFSAHSAAEVVGLLEKIRKSHMASSVTRGLLLTTFTKLSLRLRGAESERIKQNIDAYKMSMDVELQQRSCEFSSLLSSQWSSLKPTALDSMPPMDEEKMRAKKAREALGDTGEADFETMPELNSNGPSLSLPTPPMGGGGGSSAEPNLLDLDDLFGGGDDPSPSPSEQAPVPATADPLAGFGGAPTSTSSPAINGGDLLADIFATPAPIAQQQQPGAGDVMDPFAATPAPAPTPVTQPNPVITAFEKNGFKLDMELSKPNPADPQSSVITCTFTNSTMADMNSVSFQAAVPKFVTMSLAAPSGTVLPKQNGGTLTQVINVKNTQLGVKPLMLRMIISYNTNGQQTEERAQVSTFPAGY